MRGPGHGSIGFVKLRLLKEVATKAVMQVLRTWKNPGRVAGFTSTQPAKNMGPVAVGNQAWTRLATRPSQRLWSPLSFGSGFI